MANYNQDRVLTLKKLDYGEARNQNGFRTGVPHPAFYHFRQPWHCWTTDLCLPEGEGETPVNELYTNIK